MPITSLQMLQDNYDKTLTDVSTLEKLFHLDMTTCENFPKLYAYVLDNHETLTPPVYVPFNKDRARGVKQAIAGGQ
eukprot:2200250-Pyramimonas_sp.AAC.2